jgi:hypothetical protein
MMMKLKATNPPPIMSEDLPKPWTLPAVYKQEQIESFWSRTDEKTRE